MILLALTPEQAAFVRFSMDQAISFHTKMAGDLGADARTWAQASDHQDKADIARGVFDLLGPQPVRVAA